MYSKFEKGQIKEGFVLSKRPVHVLRCIIKSIVISAMRQTLLRHRFRLYVLNLLSNYPAVKEHLRLLAIKANLILVNQPDINLSDPHSVMPSNGKILLNQRAADIFDELVIELQEVRKDHEVQESKK